MATKLNWNDIINELAEGGIIPVIGPELLQVEIDGRKQNFRLWLATQLADEMDLSSEGLDEVLHPVEEVMLRHYKSGNNSSSVIPYQKVKALIARQKWEVPESLLKLTAIKDFRFLLSIIWEPFLEEALKTSWNIGDNEIRILENDLSKKPEDIDKFTSREARQQFDPEYINKLYADEAPPTIYYLYGRPSKYRTFALSEDDVLDANLLFRSPTYRPDELYNYLANKRLLLLGCNFPNWLARFFISITSPDPRHPSPQPVYVSSDAVCKKDRSLTEFLKRRDTMVIDDISVEEFIDQLYQHWIENNVQMSQSNVEENHFTEGSIFISYASEDQGKAERLYEDIKEMGLLVWLDKRELQPGDDYEAKINRNIHNSSIFIPLFSENSLIDDTDRFYHKEWNIVLELLGNNENLPKVFPARIGNVSYNDEHIPDPFRKLHWLDAPDGKISDASLAVLNTEYYRLKK